MRHSRWQHKLGKPVAVTCVAVCHLKSQHVSVLKEMDYYQDPNVQTTKAVVCAK